MMIFQRNHGDGVSTIKSWNFVQHHPKFGKKLIDVLIE